MSLPFIIFIICVMFIPWIIDPIKNITATVKLEKYKSYKAILQDGNGDTHRGCWYRAEPPHKGLSIGINR